MSSTPPNRSRALALSNLLFALTLVAASVVVYLYFFDSRFFSEGPEAPACEAGRNELVCVVNALRDQDFERVDFGRYTVSTNQLSQPGQVVEIDELNGFLFVYPAATGDQGVAARESDGANLDPDSLVISSRTSERPLNEGEDLYVVQHSNVIFILVGGTESDNAMVQDAIESLP
jgi:hypothetical protein